MTEKTVLLQTNHPAIYIIQRYSVLYNTSVQNQGLKKFDLLIFFNKIYLLIQKQIKVRFTLFCLFYQNKFWKFM